MRAEIETFILYLATERGLSDSYQLSTRLSLEAFAGWLERRAVGEAEAERRLAAGENPPFAEIAVADVTIDQIGEYLAHKKRLGLAAATIKDRKSVV